MERNTELGGNLGVTRKERALNSFDVQDHEDNATVELLGVIEAAGSFTGFRRTHRKECLNFVRRLKLLIPLLEEMRESARTRPDLVLNHSINLRRSLQSAKKLLKFCNSGSKIFLAIEGEAFMGRFHSVYDKLNQALDEIPYRELGISVEAREQVELLCLQLRRAKGRADTQDIELAMDMMVVFSEREDRNADIAILQRLAMKLDLHTVADLKEEARAIRKLIKQRGGHVTESLQQVIDQLSKFKQIVGIPEVNVLNASVSSGDPENHQPLSIPHEFLCPITLEIMTDPVIVATGQTYERESIEKWLNAGHRTCPKTGQTLLHLSVAPNFALRNLIMQWCEKNNFVLPKKERHLCGSSIMLMEEICSSVQALSCCLLDLRRKAVIKIRMLSKENPDNRILIAKVGGIPPLVTLLSYPDMKVQEHAVTALLNLSINEANKKLIARQGAVPDIIEILQNGTDEARENSAATLFSLSTLDENKALVGCSNGIPPLVALLQSGTARGKKDAATALFNLCLNQANKPRAIRAGIIPALLNLLKDKNLGMIDEALSIMLLLVSHPEGRKEAGQLSFIETLVEIMRIGTSKNKECAASVLLELGSSNSSFIVAALQFGVYEHLVQISRSGTNRAQRKACSLLQQISRCEHLPRTLPP